MNLGASEGALIRVCWGTWPLRAYLIGTQGGVLESRSTDDAILRVPHRYFEHTLFRIEQEIVKFISEADFMCKAIEKFEQA